MALSPRSTGADAIAGVVNVILKKQYTGAEVSAGSRQGASIREATWSASRPASARAIWQTDRFNAYFNVEFEGDFTHRRRRPAIPIQHHRSVIDRRCGWSARFPPPLAATTACRRGAGYPAAGSETSPAHSQHHAERSVPAAQSGSRLRGTQQFAVVCAFAVRWRCPGTTTACKIAHRTAIFQPAEQRLGVSTSLHRQAD